jgi:hypothetical protein
LTWIDPFVLHLMRLLPGILVAASPNEVQPAGSLGSCVLRFFNKIKHDRRVATRCDKLAANYLAFVQLASIRLRLRVDESTAWIDRAELSRKAG